MLPVLLLLLLLLLLPLQSKIESSPPLEIRAGRQA
jgi:hypothetical protein